MPYPPAFITQFSHIYLGGGSFPIAKDLHFSKVNNKFYALFFAYKLVPFARCNLEIFGELYNKLTNIRQHNKYLLEQQAIAPINICFADVYL